MTGKWDLDSNPTSKKWSAFWYSDDENDWEHESKIEEGWNFVDFLCHFPCVINFSNSCDCILILWVGFSYL